MVSWFVVERKVLLCGLNLIIYIVLLMAPVFIVLFGYKSHFLLLLYEEALFV
jgi:hypothetical protein